jgi:large subunit ribosomal protein L23
MMKSYHDIILAPIVTERSMDGLADRKYTFRVHDRAGKIEIAKAVEAVFPGVKVEKVTTMNVKPKPKRQGRNTSWGSTSKWKKAIVKLTADSKTIEFFEGMI